MQIFNYVLATFALGSCVHAQGQFGKTENSAEVLAALKLVNNATVRSANAATAFKAGDSKSRQSLIDENVRLRSDWQAVIFFAQFENGFYSPSGSEDIIDYVKGTLYPSTQKADLIYVKKRDEFVKSGFIDFIKPGLLQLRMAVDAASSNVQARTSAKYLREMASAFILIEHNYALTQQIQQFGPKGEEEEEDLVLQNDL